MAGPPLFDLLLLAVPAAAYVLSRRWSEAPGRRIGTAARCAGLFAIGLFASRPFLTRQAVGTGEAYNYSLALADGVAQMRAGVVPPLVGQTAYAFNGRIHPLRTAPYLFYLGAALDFAMRHRLTPWELQNLSLAFSLMAAVFACYGGLRWGTGCSRPLAFLFASVYGLSPSLLASAYSVNLFMTVHAAPFVPLVLAACFRQCRRPSRLPDFVLAGALAGAWLAHPPVACWLTLAAAVVRGFIFWRQPTWRAFRGLAGAGLLFAAMSGFVFASVGSMSSAGSFFPGGVDFSAAVMPALREAFPGCLLPVPWPSAGASVSDFQLGYVGWGLLLMLAFLAVRPPPAIRREPRLVCALLGSLAAALLLLALTLPVPGLTAWLWDHAPGSAQSLTNIWPMQRLYLVALGSILFAAAAAWSAFAGAGPKARVARRAAAALAFAWALGQAGPFVARGMETRWTADDTARSYASSNLNLTVTSYAFLGTPPTFVNGVMDPWMGFRLLRNGQEEIDSNYSTALRTAPVVARGDFPIVDLPGGQWEVKPQLVTLEPGRRYLLSFSFDTGPRAGTVSLLGRSMARTYALPSAGGAEGFGMEPGHRRGIPVWTAEGRPEPVAIGFSIPGPKPPAADFAGFTLRAIDPKRLPVRVESLLPLRFEVDAPESGDFVETPRRWLPGYEAVVMGRSLAPLMSPWRSAMVPVPKGRSEIELLYPGTPLVRVSFWLSACSWLGFVVWIGSRGAGLRPKFPVRRELRRLGSWILRRRRPLLAAAGGFAAAGAVVAFHAIREENLAAVGPIRVTFTVPFDKVGHAEPIVTTGRTGAGTTVYLRYLDGDRVRVGADIWGGSWESAPIALDYFQQQNLVVDSSGLYPLDNPLVAALPPAERDRLRGEFRVELNGRVVLDLPRPAYDSTAREVVVGRNAIGSSVVKPLFTGELLRVRRLPIPRRLALAAGQDLELSVRFPSGHLGLTEPLLALGQGGRDGFCGVTYLPEGRLRFAAYSADGRMIDDAEEPVDRGSGHELSFSLGRAGDGSGRPAVRMDVDGKPALRPEGTLPLALPELVLTGSDPAPPPGAEARFTGPALEPEAASSCMALRTRGSGPLRLVLSFPEGRTGHQEPLVATGVAGRGDFVYVVYADDRHVRLGYDHWGVSGGLSPPIEVDYRAAHDVVVSLGSLYPDESDPAWAGLDSGERRRLKSEITVRLDGRKVFRVESPAWPSAAEDITPGANRIQGSNCGPVFSGLIYSIDRLGLPPPRSSR